ncbi:mechanosensitive ion channel family protein [Tabrizicola piscis]|uniref:Mechanosensitive ion channel family protein n=1 Tax=Tabrizicola piscis TaxID=2494374 RepID=A0A3S8U564_9RHOB|nr:mechanosensitive ion channel family protein [Tabrizicola piscis]AZL58737.1 mechanosensitive ion channel family protein [Tabrizicola piscis]
MLALVLGGFAGSAVAQVQPPAKVEQLLEVLSDPEVRAWLDAQLAAPSAAVPQPGAADAASQMSSVLARIRNHAEALIHAFPTLPAQMARARDILLVEFKDRGPLSVLVLLAAFIAGGIGLDKVLRSLTGGYRAWMTSIPTTNPVGRLKTLGARTLYAAMLIAAFMVGSLGVFLLFNWPPLLREIVLTFLTAAVVTRIALMLGRVVLMPPFLGMANAADYRVVVMSDARAAHWYRWIGWIVGWFMFAGATLTLMKTLGFDEPGRLAIGSVAGFVQLLLVLAAIWLRPEVPNAAPRRIGSKAASWLLTVFFVTLWLLRISGAYTAFWLLFAVVALPALILATRAAVTHLLRPPEDASPPFPQVAVAIIDRGLRVILILVGTFLLARALGLELEGMAQGESTQERLLRGGLRAVVILLAADFCWSIIKAMIAHRMGADLPQAGGEEALPADNPKLARMRTLLPIIQNILFAAILVMAVLMVLSSLGIEIAPLIAGAGVVGVAIGFGAQTVVKDVISGMFYLFDDAFRVGEYIETGSHKGTVESFSLRSVKLRHHRGALSTVPFGELGAIRNMSRDWVIDKFRVTVGYQTDLETLRKLIKKLGAELAADPEFAAYIIAPLKMQGVQSFGDYGIAVELKMTTLPGQQFQIRRRAYVRLKQIFAEQGIEIPFPTVHVQGGGDGAGTAAAQAIIADKLAKETKSIPAP